MALDQQGIDQLVHEAYASSFKDRRLRNRLATIIGKLAVSPAKSFPDVFSSAELEGAYPPHRKRLSAPFRARVGVDVVRVGRA